MLAPIIERVFAIALGLSLIGEVALGGTDVTNRRIQPDIKKLVVLARNFESEIRSVAADTPIGEPSSKPTALEVVENGRVERPLPFAPCFEEIGKVREPEKIMIRGAAHSGRATNRTARLNEFGRRVGAAAFFTNIAVLIGRLAFRTDASDKSIRQKAPILLAKGQFNRAFLDMAAFEEFFEDAFAVTAIFLGIGRSKIIE